MVISLTESNECPKGYDGLYSIAESSFVNHRQNLHTHRTYLLLSSFFIRMRDASFDPYGILNFPVRPRGSSSTIYGSEFFKYNSSVSKALYIKRLQKIYLEIKFLEPKSGILIMLQIYPHM